MGQVELNVESNGQSVSFEVTVTNRLGLHARPAMSFVDVAGRFKSDIQVHKGGQAVDGKSIMQMMMLAATQGTKLRIQVTGQDSAEAAHALRDLIEQKFGEE